jgi:hypothetical protein
LAGTRALGLSKSILVMMGSLEGEMILFNLVTEQWELIILKPSEILKL